MSQFIEMFFNERHPLQQLKPHIEVIRGVSYKPSDVREDATASSVIILRSNNINNGVINNEDIVYVDSDRVSDSQFVSVGDIIMCGSNGSKSLVGKAAMIDSKPKHQMSFGAFCLGIRCKRTILSKYLSTYFQSSIYRNKIESLGSGTNILNIKPEHIYNLEIPIPSIEEQKLFVSLAQQADKSEFVGFKSQFIEEFGTMDSPKWETKTLPEISQNMDSKRIPIRSGNRKQGKYPYYGASGIVDYVDDYIFDEKILLVSEDGANLKERVAPIAFSSEGKVWVNNHAHVLRFNDYSLQKFVEYYLNYNKIDRYLTGTAQPKLNQDKLNNIPIPFPPEKQLRRFDCLTQQADKSEKCCEFRLAS